MRLAAIEKGRSVLAIIAYAPTISGDGVKKPFQKGEPAAMQTPISPMLCEPSQPFDSDDYLFETKWDGERAILFFENKKIIRMAGDGESLCVFLTLQRIAGVRFAQGSCSPAI